MVIWRPLLFERNTFQLEYWGVQSDLRVYNYVSYEQIIWFLTRCFDNNIKIRAPQIKCSEVDTSEGCTAVQADRWQSTGQKFIQSLDSALWISLPTRNMALTFRDQKQKWKCITEAECPDISNHNNSLGSFRETCKLCKLCVWAQISLDKYYRPAP